MMLSYALLLFGCAHVFLARLQAPEIAYRFSQLLVVTQDSYKGAVVQQPPQIRRPSFSVTERLELEGGEIDHSSIGCDGNSRERERAS